MCRFEPGRDVPAERKVPGMWIEEMVFEPEKNGDPGWDTVGV